MNRIKSKKMDTRHTGNRRLAYYLKSLTHKIITETDGQIITKWKKLFDDCFDEIHRRKKEGSYFISIKEDS